MENSLQKKAASGFLWQLVERLSNQCVSFIISVILARLLDPEAYGIVAIISAFTLLTQVFVDGGMANSLIQKKDADDLDFSSFFYFSVCSSIVLYILLFLIAPIIADFYQIPELTTLIRVDGIIVLLAGLKSVQQAYISRHMLFRRVFVASLGGTIGGAIIGITMAFTGYGVWALIAQAVTNVAVNTVILWFTVNWRPKWMFSFSRIKPLFSYGWKFLVSYLVDTLYGNIRTLTIGKVYTSTDLAYYNKGSSFPNLIINSVNTPINNVLLPAMSSKQENLATVKAMTRRSVKLSTYLITPLLLGLCFVAKPFILFLLTEKWLPCVPFLQIFCFTYIFQPIQTANRNAINAIGRSDLFLKLEIIKKTMGVTFLIVTIPISVEAIGYGFLLSGILNQLIDMVPNKKLFGYGYRDQIKDILPGFLLSLAMGICISFVALLNLPPFFTLLIQIPLGVAIYLLVSILLRLDSFYYILNLLKSFLNKRKTAVE